MNSVVFASAYRFTVLFSYSALDPSYTLAPTVGWTAIEMSAGIVSACLPTLVPALKWIGRNIGLGKLMSLTTSRGTSHGASKPTLVTAGGTGASAQRSDRRRSLNKDGDFYRLSDEEAISADDHSFDPKHGRNVTVASSPGMNGRSRRMSGDEIPLNGIRIQTDFRQERH